VPLCLLKGFDAGGLGLTAVDLDLASESDDVDEADEKEGKRDFDLYPCKLCVFANGDPLVVPLADVLSPRIRVQPEVAVAVEEDSTESREEVRKRLMVPRVRISSVDKERALRAVWRWPVPFRLRSEDEEPLGV